MFIHMLVYRRQGDVYGWVVESALNVCLVVVVALYSRCVGDEGGVGSVGVVIGVCACAFVVRGLSEWGGGGADVTPVALAVCGTDQKSSP